MIQITYTRVEKFLLGGYMHCGTMTGYPGGNTHWSIILSTEERDKKAILRELIGLAIPKANKIICEHEQMLSDFYGWMAINPIEPNKHSITLKGN